MVHPVVRIADLPLQIALWVYILTFLISLLLMKVFLRSPKHSLDDYFKDEFDRYYQEKIQNPSLLVQSRRRPVKPSYNEHKIVFQLTLLSCLLALMSFLVVSFVPLPYISNWTRSDPLEVAPLRITSLSYDRFYNGFSLKGDIWNQGQTPMVDLSARVKVWGKHEQLLEEILVKIKPRILQPDSSGHFRLKYSKDSPSLLFGYEIEFVNTDGEETAHIRGFDAL